ncbi:MAG: PHP domain-containing protein [Desulfurococcus sp.]|nr:PHP domain-containing protein [Desulfurococcus sp.]
MIRIVVVADLHIHSVYSDGKATPREIIRYAADKGVHVISITDHDTFKGGVEGYRLSRSLDSRSGLKILVVPGVELKSEAGDILVYCPNEVDLPRSIGPLIDKAHESNCIIAPAHPFDTLRNGIGELVYEYRGWDAIEVWNARSSRKANSRAMDAALALGKPGLANSDAHIPEHIASAYTVLYIEEPSSVEDVLDAIRRGLVKPVAGTLSLGGWLKGLSWSIEYRMRKLYGSKQDL